MLTLPLPLYPWAQPRHVLLTRVIFFWHMHTSKLLVQNKIVTVFTQLWLIPSVNRNMQIHKFSSPWLGYISQWATQRYTKSTTHLHWRHPNEEEGGFGINCIVIFPMTDAGFNNPGWTTGVSKTGEKMGFKLDREIFKATGEVVSLERRAKTCYCKSYLGLFWSII